MLETVREYAQERLRAHPDEESRVRLRHLSHVAAFAEAARPALFGPEQGAWLRRLDQERENALAALAFARRSRDAALPGLRLASARSYYWIQRGQLRLGHRVTTEALAHPGAQRGDRARARGLFDAGRLDVCMGRYADGRRWLDASLALARELRDDGLTSAALNLLSVAALGERDLATARACAEEALALARRQDDPMRLAAALNAVAQILRLAGELDDAEALYRQCQALAEAHGDRDNLAICLLNRAMVALARGDAAGARGMLRKVHALVRETGSRQAGQSLLEVCAALAGLDEDWPRVAEFFGSAEAQVLETGIQRDPADEAAIVPQLRRARAALGNAAFDAAAREAGRQRYDEAIAHAGDWLAEGR
jgi:tetratricopeptide (TPR) repeat protein